MSYELWMMNCEWWMLNYEWWMLNYELWIMSWMMNVEHWLLAFWFCLLNFDFFSSWLFALVRGSRTILNQRRMGFAPLPDLFLCVKHNFSYLLFCFSKKVTKKEPRKRLQPVFGIAPWYSFCTTVASTVVPWWLELWMMNVEWWIMNYELWMMNVEHWLLTFWFCLLTFEFWI